jgi:hypothetical protein
MKIIFESVRCRSNLENSMKISLPSTYKLTFSPVLGVHKYSIYLAAPTSLHVTRPSISPRLRISRLELVTFSLIYSFFDLKSNAQEQITRFYNSLTTALSWSTLSPN